MDRKKKRKNKYVDSDNNIDDENIEEFEALLSKRFHRGKGKYKGKMPIICFNCHEVGHIVVRFLEKKNRDEGVETNTRAKEMMTTRATRTKVRSPIT